MDLRPDGKKVLVTGAGSGIGREIALQFAKYGADVLIVARTGKDLRETAALNSRISWLVADLTTAAGVDCVAREIIPRFGKLDVLVNNVGWSPVHPFGDETMDEIMYAFDVNVNTVCRLVLSTLPLLKKQPRQHYQYQLGCNSQPYDPNVCPWPCKGCRGHVHKIWPKEFAPYGIRVNSVSHGPVESPIYDKPGISKPEKEAHMIRMTAGVPLGRLG